MKQFHRYVPEDAALLAARETEERSHADNVRRDFASPRDLIYFYFTDSRSTPVRFAPEAK